MAWCHHCHRDVGVMVVMIGKGDSAQNAMAGGVAKQCNRCQRPIDSEPTVVRPAPQTTAKVIPIASARSVDGPAPQEAPPPIAPDDLEGSTRRRLAWLEAKIAEADEYKAESRRLKKVLSVLCRPSKPSSP